MKRALGLALAGVAALAITIRIALRDAPGPTPADSRPDSKPNDGQSSREPAATEVTLRPVEPSVEPRSEVASDVGVQATFDVHGRVLDELKRPIVEFGLHAIHRDENNWFVERRDWPNESHAKGEFDLQGLVAGRWEIAPFADGVKLERTLEFTRVVDRRIDFEMTGVATITGFVLDPDGQPVADAQVTVDGDARELRTAVSGAFLIEVLPGAHHIRARKRGFAASDAQPIHVGTRDRQGGVELTLNRGATLRGVLADERRRPLAGWSVSCAADELPYSTDDEGRFTIVGADTGVVGLRFSKPGTDQGVMHSVVELAQDATKDVRFTFARERTVHVVGSVKKNEVFELLDISVQAASFEDRLTSSNVYIAEVDAEGRFELDLPTFGRFRFSVEAGASDELSARVIEVPDSHDFEVALEP